MNNTFWTSIISDILNWQTSAIPALNTVKDPDPSEWRSESSQIRYFQIIKRRFIRRGGEGKYLKKK